MIHLNSERSELIEQLYILYEQPMYRIAYAILHNVEQSEDAVHDAFVAVIKSGADFDRADSEETKHYMIRTVRNTAINRYRKNAADVLRLTSIDDSASELPDSRDDITIRMRHIEQKEIADSIMSGLTEQECEILRLRCEEELSYKEIGKRLSLSEAAVRKRFERARKSARNGKGAMLYGKEVFTL